MLSKLKVWQKLIIAIVLIIILIFLIEFIWNAVGSAVMENAMEFELISETPTQFPLVIYDHNADEESKKIALSYSGGADKIITLLKEELSYDGMQLSFFGSHLNYRATSYGQHESFQLYLDYANEVDGDIISENCEFLLSSFPNASYFDYVVDGKFEIRFYLKHDEDILNALKEVCERE